MSLRVTPSFWQKREKKVQKIDTWNQWVKKYKNTISSTQHYYRNKQSNSNFTHNNYTNVTLSSYRIFARVLRQNVDSVPIPGEVFQFRQPKSANKYMGSYNDWLEIGDHYWRHVLFQDQNNTCLQFL